MRPANATDLADGAAKVFKTMVDVEVECSPPKVLNEGSPTAHVTGFVTFAVAMSIQEKPR